MGADQCQAGRILSGRPCPLAPIHEPNTEDPAQDWAVLFRPGDLTSAIEDEWGFELGQYGLPILQLVPVPSPSWKLGRPKLSRKVLQTAWRSYAIPAPACKAFPGCLTGRYQ